MNEKSRNFELVEPASPEALVPDSWVEPWMIATAVLVIVILAVLIFRKKKASPLDPLTTRQAAFEKAVTELDKIGEVPAREAAVRSSLILRKYLSVATGDPALFETHEETISRHDALQGFSAEARDAAGSEFGRLAALKYAREISAVSGRDVVAGSRTLLATLHRGFQT